MKHAVVSTIICLNLWPQAAEAKGTEPIDVKIKFARGFEVDEDDVFVVWNSNCPLKAGPLKKVTLSEQGAQYTPAVSVALVGETLEVKNADKIQHNSFALKNESFDSGLQKPQTNYEKVLTKAGVTKVFCRIHPRMSADILVLNNICYKALKGAKSHSDFSLATSPGSTKLWIWSQRLKGFKSLEAKAGAKVEFLLEKADFIESKGSKSPPPSSEGYQ